MRVYSLPEAHVLIVRVYVELKCVSRLAYGVCLWCAYTSEYCVTCSDNGGKKRVLQRIFFELTVSVCGVTT